MALIFRLLIGAGLFVLGVVMATHDYQLTQLFGHNDLAERYLGGGGTYSMWKLLGVVCIVGGLLYAL